MKQFTPLTEKLAFKEFARAYWEFAERVRKMSLEELLESEPDDYFHDHQARFDTFKLTGTFQTHYFILWGIYND